MILKPCKFRFDGSPHWDGMELGGWPKHHGFSSVGVTPVVLEAAAAWVSRHIHAAHAAELRKLRPCANGLIYLKSPPWLITVFAPEEVARISKSVEIRQS